MVESTTNLGECATLNVEVELPPSLAERLSAKMEEMGFTAYDEAIRCLLEQVV